jgi:hypothetical protein
MSMAGVWPAIVAHGASLRCRLNSYLIEEQKPSEDVVAIGSPSGWGAFRWLLHQ